MTSEKWVYEFSEGSRDMRDLLGGKGANVAEMTRVLGDRARPTGVHDHHRGVRRLHARGPRARRARRSRSPRRCAASRRRPASASATTRTRCSSPSAAARASRCPGMLDTILNVGLNDTRRASAWRASTDNEWFAWDSYRRLVQMFGNVGQRRVGREVRGCDRRRSSSDAGVETDTELSVDAT